MRFHPKTTSLAFLAAFSLLAIACTIQGTPNIAVHRWWNALGPVLPHDTFPTDCSLCHVGQEWNTLKKNFDFDHERETGVALNGAHSSAQCLRCHNDRGPVSVYAAQGCVGCHEDFHYGELGTRCQECHKEHTWRPEGMIELHNHTRFPLVGSHVRVACHRCHPGSFVGNFVPTDTECLTCHTNDLYNANNPNHIALGYVDDCHQCHIPTSWNQAEFNN